jgi:hypothetical protein
MATMMAGRLTNRYDLMDSAYDAPEIAAKSRALGHVPIVDPNPRRDSNADASAEARAKRHAGHVLAEDVRFNERSAAERVNGALKEQIRWPIRAFAQGDAERGQRHLARPPLMSQMRHFRSFGRQSA